MKSYKILNCYLFNIAMKYLFNKTLRSLLYSSLFSGRHYGKTRYILTISRKNRGLWTAYYKTWRARLWNEKEQFIGPF